MYEIKIKIKHECPYLNISNLFDIPVYNYCSELYDLIIIPQKITEDEKETITSFISDRDSIEIVSGGVDCSKTYIYFKCMCSTTTAVSPRIQQAGGIIEHPIVNEDGWENYKIVCLNLKTQSTVLKAIQQLPEYEIISIRDLGREGIFKSQFLSIYDLISNMTDKQIEVISEAYETGYYEIPRKVKTETIARKFEVSRVATEKSLRKAENEIMKTIMPFILFHKRIRKDPEISNKIKLQFSNEDFALT